MRLPPALAAAIEEYASRYPQAALARAAEELSVGYRGQTPRAPQLTSDLHRAGYLVTRVPATYAAARLVFQEARNRVAAPLHNLLDLGAGPGTAAWAAVDTLPEVERVTLVELAAPFIALGKELAAQSEHPALRDAEWLQADLRSAEALPAHDLVALAYSLGELGTTAQHVLEAAWQAARVALVVIEPGTPRGYTTVLQARTQLLAGGAHIAAPCPHELECPMASLAGEWCHFAARVERSQRHRRAKSADLSYEDEKFSYMVAAKTEVTRAANRIVRHPLHRKGHIQLELCVPSGLKRQMVTKRDRENFRRARKARWGDDWLTRQ
jgi:ribosomal protein RSM22 (predicted rRNA methylase)